MAAKLRVVDRVTCRVRPGAPKLSEWRTFRAQLSRRSLSSSTFAIRVTRIAMTTDVISMANQAIAMVRESNAILTAGGKRSPCPTIGLGDNECPQSASLADKIDKY
jgi:hypothetical protein